MLWGHPRREHPPCYVSAGSFQEASGAR